LDIIGSRKNLHPVVSSEYLVNSIADKQLPQSHCKHGVKLSLPAKV